MTTTQDRQRRDQMEWSQRETMDSLIGEQVLHALGEPWNLLKVRVCPLWQDYYRANVFVGTNVTCATIAKSYFLKVDGDGKIVDVTPKISKQY